MVFPNCLLGLVVLRFKVGDNFTINLISVSNQGFGIGCISSANIHKIRCLMMFYILILEGHGLHSTYYNEVPILMGDNLHSAIK